KDIEDKRLEPGLYKSDGTFVKWDILINDGIININNGTLSSNYKMVQETWMGMPMNVYKNLSSDALDGDLVVPNGEDITLAENAFNQCQKLKSVTFADNVVAINKWAFANCSALVSIDLEKSTRLTTIKSQLVANCNVLEIIKLPSSITTIEEGAIASSNSLTNFEIGHLSNLATIEYNAISCKVTRLDISSSVQNIEAGAFIYCNNLESINVDASNPNYCSVDGVLFTKDMKTLICYPAGKRDIEYNVPSEVNIIPYESFYRVNKLEKLILPSSITTIENRAFQYSTALKEVSLENCTNLVSIGNYIFSDCTSLINAKLPSNLTTIPLGTFNNCTALETVAIPKNVKTIGETAFYNCSAITEINCPTELTNIGIRAFANCKKLSTIIFYEKLSIIEKQAFQNCDSLTTINYTGTSSQWSSISIDNYNSYNEDLLNANVNFEYTI
ncbi:MAG: leucine-rich repeat domain-containing protein, partial [Clostridia bacterium]|nr:leucine-rich repeat domain-containing protein [Clostridia bacterium]